MFHSTALVFLPVYTVSHKKWTRSYCFCVAMIFIIIFIFRNSLGSLIIKLFREEYIDRYISSGEIGEVALLILFMIILGAFINNPIRYTNIYNTILFNIISIAFIIQMLSSYSYAFTRLNFYFFQFIILYLPNIFSNMNNSIIKLSNKQAKIISSIAKSITLVLLILYYMKNLETPAYGSFPYHFFWE